MGPRSWFFYSQTLRTVVYSSGHIRPMSPLGGFAQYFINPQNQFLTLIETSAIVEQFFA